MIIRKVCHKCHCGKPSHDKLMKMANMVEGYNNEYLAEAVKGIDEAIKAMEEEDSIANLTKLLKEALDKKAAEHNEETSEEEEPRYYVSDAMHDLMIKFAEELNHYVVVSTENLNDLKKTVASFKEMMLRSKHIDEQEQSN
jgi:hypothetical protein